MATAIHAVPLQGVTLRDGFWSPRQQLMTDVTIPYMERILRDEVPGAAKSNAIRNFRMAAGEESGTFYGMVFQDSDVAKWLEAAAYSLMLKDDPALSKSVDEVVALIGRAQQPDGYLNTYFTVKNTIPRWTNLLECHELYCAGHMIEAAVALHEAAGKDELLGIVLRLVDHIEARFGEDGTEGIPGHQEIELALMRLYRVTGDARHRDLALRFLNLRGQDPEFFKKHTPDAVRGLAFGDYGIDPADNIYNQSDVPVRAQTTARGHAVRQVYMLAGMAEAAAATDDPELTAACERMFTAITERQMYATGAVGASAHLESFGGDYVLPPDLCYGETCAAVAMAFFAHSMLAIAPDGRYADLMELELYNAALAGMQLDGKRFFYVNPLDADPAREGRPEYAHVLIERPKWHACACCPPNLARLITSLSGYLLSEDGATVYVHLPIGCDAKATAADLSIRSEYPWNGRAVYTVTACRAPFTLALHIPGHAVSPVIRVNGEAVAPRMEKGYAYIERAFAPGDTVELTFDMPPRRLHTHPLVRETAGMAALARGPIVYCFEGADNGDLSAAALPADCPVDVLPYDGELLGGVVPLRAGGLPAIPYYAWSTRGKNAMRVFLPEPGA